MKFTLPETAFPPLALSSEERAALAREAERVVDETLAANDVFLQRGGRVKTAMWKHYRTKEGMRVYRQRSMTTPSDRNYGYANASDVVRPVRKASRSASEGSTTSKSKSKSKRTTRQQASPAASGLRAALQSTVATPSRWMARLARASRRSSVSGAGRGHDYDDYDEDEDDDEDEEDDDEDADVDDSKSTPLSEPRARWKTSSSRSIEFPDHQWWMETHKPSHVPAILSVGAVEGTVEDAIYAVQCVSDSAWKWRNSQVNDRFDDMRLLATIRKPTPDEPLRFMGIKWCTKEHPAALATIVKRRDFLFVEATGMRYDAARDEQVGYFLMHSVQLARVPTLEQFKMVRGNLSICFLLRQRGAQLIETFIRGFSDPMGSLMESVSVRLASESLLACLNIVDFAYVKKLQWLMARREEDALSSSRHRHRHGTAHEVCKTCFKSTAPRGFSAFTLPSTACQICRETICSKCAMIKQLTVSIAADGTAVQRRLTFCLPCVLKAKQLPAKEIAVAELPGSHRGRRGKLDSESSRRSPQKACGSSNGASTRKPRPASGAYSRSRKD